MNNNTAEVLNRGMECLLAQMNIVDAEHFIFLVKAENFDYTKWQREHFDRRSPAELDQEMDTYFTKHPYSGDPAKII